MAARVRALSMDDSKLILPHHREHLKKLSAEISATDYELHRIRREKEQLDALEARMREVQSMHAERADDVLLGCAQLCFKIVCCVFWCVQL